MAYSTITNLDVTAAQQHSHELLDRVLSTESSTYVTGPTGTGNGERVLVLGGTGYIGRALVPELARRGYRPAVLARNGEIKNEAEYADAEVIVGDATKAADVVAAVAAAPTAVVISLLSGRKPNDAEDCRQVDHEAVVHGIKAAVAHDVKQFIHISDYGVYRPELIPQVYKIQVEGELIGQHHGYVPWTIIRPTAYFPYLSVAFGDVKNDLAYRIYDHGEYNVVNPIAREDLAEFIVNQVLNDDAIGRVLPSAVRGRPTTRSPSRVPVSSCSSSTARSPSGRSSRWPAGTRRSPASASSASSPSSSSRWSSTSRPRSTGRSSTTSRRRTAPAR